MAKFDDCEFPSCLGTLVINNSYNCELACLNFAEARNMSIMSVFCIALYSWRLS